MRTNQAAPVKRALEFEQDLEWSDLGRDLVRFPRGWYIPVSVIAAALVGSVFGLIVIAQVLR